MYSRYKRIIPRIYRQATTISIGNITKTCADPINPNLVPSGYLPKTIEQTTLRHLKWLLQKDLLSQDVFLIGHPGPTRRRLVFQYLEMTNREYEYLAISRDTTDSDVKQRRELVDGTSVYSDSPAVKAAIHGRVLILDGIERAERNVLPILNNLLENREMQLDDGRFLVSSRRYDKLRERYSVEELTKDKLIRVNEDFRVIALGLPTPSYTGNLLDPPLRSRFQARQVIHELPKNKELSNIEQSLRILTTSEVTDFGIKVATESIAGAVELENSLKFDSIKDLLKTVYPYNHLHKSKVQEHVDSFIYDKKLTTRIDDISIDSNFVLTENNEKLLSKMLASHNSGFDICLIGGKGSGKTKIVDQFAINADLEVQPVLLYKDMSWRELLQQRYTDSVTGDTKWAPSPLVRAALKGQLCVLDGVDHLHAGVLSALQSLIHDRTMDLPDGTRLVRHDRYNAETPDSKVLAIHKDFRIIAIADTSKNQKWLNTDTSSLFHFHEMCQYNQNEIKQISNCPEKLIRVLGFCQNHEDLSKSLSLRAILRISNVQDLTDKRLSYEIERACMSRFLPNNVKKDLEGILKYADLPTGVLIDDFEHVETKMVTFSPEKTNKAPNVKVPDTIFFANEQQEKIINSLINDMNNKQDMLLVGNQGVGKNKIVDHMLQKVDKPCEYVQLHRDTTVQSLITESKVVSGKLEIGDSALIRALKTGTVLMLDEVDKAPTHITAILKSLVDKQAFTLPDGRVLDFENNSHELDEGFIKVHPDFQMIVLANRPGFPFLGNNFFAVMGDRFSCHVIDNPTKTATLDLLKPYAPRTDVETLKKLVTAFSKLRNLNEESILNYPYSTREIVSIAKHFDAYPNDGIVAALNNVFDFDMADDVVLERVSEVLSQSGIPIVGGKEAIKVQLAEVQKLSAIEVLEINGLNKFDKKSYSVAVRVVGDHDHVQFQSEEAVRTFSCDIENSRNSTFTERSRHLNLPDFGRYAVVTDSAFHADADSKTLYVVHTNPTVLYRIDLENGFSKKVDLSDVFFSYKNRSPCGFQVLALDESICVVFQRERGCMSVVDFGKNKVGETDAETGLDVAKVKFSSKMGQKTGLDPWRRLVYPDEDRYDPKIPLFRATKAGRFIVAWNYQVDSTQPEFDGQIQVFDQKSGKVFSLDIKGCLDYNSSTTVGEIKSVTALENDNQIMVTMGDNFDTICFEIRVENDSATLVEIGDDLVGKIAGNGARFKGVANDHTEKELTVEKRTGTKQHQQPSNTTNTSTIQHETVPSPGDKTQNIPIINSNSRQVQHFFAQKAALPSTTINSDIVSALVSSDQVQIRRQPGLVDSNLHAQQENFGSSWRDIKSKFSKNSQQNKKYEVYSQDPVYLGNNTFARVTAASTTDKTVSAQSQDSSGNRTSGFEQKNNKNTKTTATGNTSLPQAVIQVFNHNHGTFQEIPIESSVQPDRKNAWEERVAPSVKLYLSGSENSDKVYATTTSGHIYEYQLVNLQSDLAQWHRMVGEDSKTSGSDSGQRLELKRNSGLDNTAPKHGKIDPENTPHVGGNTWAGGTGGRDTAGLGGKGGPYRLDAGHDVHQLSDAEKDNVPEHLKEQAKEMGKKAYEKRLKEIGISGHDHKLYESISEPVRKETDAIKTLMNSIEEKKRGERVWLKNQTDGDWDDAKLVERLVGERNVYKRRIDDKEGLHGEDEAKPRRLRLVVDVSGSMYRFNGMDKRLQRSAETVCMIMEAFQGHQDKIQLDIVGHSGDSPVHSLATLSNFPKNDKERLKVLEKMYAHAQFCQSGDNTLEGIRAACRQVASDNTGDDDEDSGEKYVLALSDANLERYGIHPSYLSKALTFEPNVNAAIVFIGSMDTEAERVCKQLPPNKAFVCLQLDKLPQVLKTLLTSTIL